MSSSRIDKKELATYTFISSTSSSVLRWMKVGECSPFKSKRFSTWVDRQLVVVVTGVERLTAGIVLHIDVTKKYISPSRNKRPESPSFGREYLPRTIVVNMRMTKSNAIATPSRKKAVKSGYFAREENR